MSSKDPHRRRTSAALLSALFTTCALPIASTHAADLVGYWDFNDPGNPGAERSGNSPNVTLAGSAALTANSGGQSGQPGDRGLDLGTINDGSAATLAGGTHFDVLSSSSVYSVVLWQYTRRTGNTSSFWFTAPLAGGSARGIQAHIPWGNGTIYFDQSGCCGGAERLTVGGQVAINQWQHFVFQRDASGNRTIWVNGSQVASAGGGATLDPLNGVLAIGSAANAAQSINGIIDDFAVFSGTLTPAEIATLAAGNPPLDLVLDTDNDGMPDSYEDANGLNKLVDDAGGDLDGDGLKNVDEFTRKTDPQDPDTDSDTLNDGPEVAAGTDPLDPDTDADGLDDAAEIAGGTDPLDVDTDDDGLADGQEGTFGTDPLDPDTDRDGALDGQEVSAGTDPLDDTSFPPSLADFSPAVGRFVEVVKNNTTDTQLHIGEIEVFAFGIAADQADGDGTSRNDLVQAGSPSTEFPPTTTILENGVPSSVYDGDLESTAAVWTTSPGLGVEPRYMLDLGATKNIGKVRVWGRLDPCCTNRLENFTVKVYEDDGSGQPGTLVNSALFPGVAPSADLGPAELDLALPDAGIRSFTVDKPFIPTGEPIVLSWEVNPNATAIEIDNGIGDVTALTDGSGFGSIPINPALSADITYRMIVYRPTGNSAASLTVTVTDQPIIFHLTADQDIVAPSTPVQLTWDVTNVTALDLNGTNVFDMTGTTVQPTVSATYTLTATNAMGVTTTSTRVRVVIPGEPVISEFMAQNHGDVTADEDGDSSDWIEICNPNGTAKSLHGYYLTDDPNNLTKWQLPNVSMGANSYLLLFASGKDRAVPASELHTSFALQESGEYLALVQPNGLTVVSEYWPAFPNQRPEISYGFNNQSAEEGYFLTPTPGAENGASFTGFVGDTSFSHDRGFYSFPINVEITTSEPGAIVRYTLDGTLPTERSGLIYSGPIPISSTTVLRAAGFKTGFVPTNVDTQTYLFTSDIITQPGMRTSITQHPVYGPQMDASLKAVPTISLVVPPVAGQQPSTYIDRTELAGSVEFINFEAGDTQENVGLSRFGNYVTNFPKRGVRVAFRSEYGAGKLRFPVFDGHEYNIDPALEVDALDLRSGNHDMVARGAYLSNRFTDDTMDAMDNIAPHGRFVHVYINGSYNGQYHMRERWSAAMLAEYFPGKKADYESINANNSGSNFQTGTPTDGTGQHWNETRALVAGPNPYVHSRTHLDVANVIDFMILWVSGNSESEFRSGGSPPLGVPFKFFMKDADGFLRNPNHSATHQGPISSMAEFAAEAHPDYKILLADRIHKHFFNDGAFTPARNIARLQERVDEAQVAFYSEAARWDYRTPSSWQSYQSNLINNHFPNLTRNMINRFRSAGMYLNVTAPSFNQHGGTVPSGFNLTMRVPVGTAYYTLDGTDPRLSEVTGGTPDPPVILVAENAAKTVHVPQTATDGFTDGDGNDWNEVAYDDASWTAGTGGVGYEVDSGYEPFFKIDVGAEMLGSRTSCLIRIPFTIAAGQLDDVDGLELLVRYDDGFVACLNGVEVDRRLFTGTPDGDSGASGTHSDGQAVNFESLDITDHLGELQVGNNVLAIHGLNFGAGSGDFLISAELHGTDVPQVTGGISPTAVQYTAPVALNSATVVKSRVLSGNTWSALNEATFVIDSGGLVVSEFHYDPPSATEGEIAAGFNDSEDFEFFEFLNAGSSTIDLTGIRLDTGITFDFATGAITSLAPGERVLVVENIPAFEFRYGPGYPIAGQYGGKLNDGGELVRIVNTLHTALIEFTYDNAAPWPLDAAGSGSSLVLSNPASDPDHNNAANWTASGVPGGTPGFDDLPPLDFATWAAANGVSDPNADDDGDRLTNYDEWLRGTPPNSVSLPPADFGRIEFLNVGGVIDPYLTLSFTYSLAADNVTAGAQASDDLATWNGGPGFTVHVRTVYHGDGTATATWRSATPIGGHVCEFLRGAFTSP